MICALSFCATDRLMALELSRHIECLGGVKQHRCIVFHPDDTDSDGIRETLRRAFESVQIVEYPGILKGWPDGPNQAFWTACDTISRLQKPEPWLWMEADCVLTRHSWLDEINQEYQFCGKPILGVKNKTFDGKGKPSGEHITGVAVYPANLISLVPVLKNIVETTDGYRKAGNLPPAFDCYIAPYVLPITANSKTITHFWKAHSFKESNGAITCQFKHPYGVSNIVDMTAPLIHGCKDFSLLDIVQQRLTATIPVIMKENA